MNVSGMLGVGLRLGMEQDIGNGVYVLFRNDYALESNLQGHYTQSNILFCDMFV